MAYRRWVRCRDVATGSHIDVDWRQVDRLVKAGAVEPIEGYPVREGENVWPRPPKPFRPLKGLSESKPDGQSGEKTKSVAARSSISKGDEQ